MSPDYQFVEYWNYVSAITPQLYLSDIESAENDAILEELGITHVVSVLRPPVSIPERIPIGRQLCIDIDDLCDSDMLIHLDNTTTFIREAIEADPQNKVLVHCMAGVSRSPTVVCAYLMATDPDIQTVSDAIRHVENIREIIDPNVGFREQLEVYCQKLGLRRLMIT